MKRDFRSGVSKFIAILSICLASIYLTFLVDCYTLNTTLKRLFVFAYFLVMCSVFVYLKHKFIKVRNSTNRKWPTIILSGIISIAVLSIYQDTFLPSQVPTQISLTADGTGEVWLTDLEIEGEQTPLSKLKLVSNDNWEYNTEYDDYVYYPNDVGQNNELILEIPGGHTRLFFAANEWSGVVTIGDSDGKTHRLDLKKNDKGNSGEVEYQNDYIRFYSILEQSLFTLSACIVLMFFLDSILQTLNKKVNVNSITSFLYNAFSCEIKKSIAAKMLHIILAIILLFMVCGQKLFLEIFSIKNLLIFSIGIVPAYFVCVVFLHIIDLLQKQHSKTQSVIKYPIKDTPVSPRVISILLAIIISIPSTVIIGNAFFRPRQSGEVQILPLNQNGIYSKSSEVWLLDVIVNGEHKNLKSLDLPSGWIENEYGSITYSSQESNPKPLIITYPEKSHVYLKFLHHTWSGMVEIKDGNKKEQIDLSDTRTSYYYEITGNQTPITSKLILEYGMVMAILFFIFHQTIYYSYREIYSCINGYRQRSWFLLFLTAFSVFSLYFFLCKPGFLNKDATVQWSQALNLVPLTTGHPIVSTLFWRLCSRLFPSISFIVFIQYTLIAAILATCFMVLIDCGVQRSHVIILLLFLSFLPNHALLAISATKDGLYCSLLLLMGVSLFNVIYRGQKIAFGQFIISSVLVCLLRHEGFAVVILASLVLFFLSILKNRWRHCIIIILCIFLLTAGVNSGLSNFYLEKDNLLEGSSIFSHLIIGVHANGGDIGAIGENYLKTYAGDIPIEELESLYDPYNSDTIGWSRYHSQLAINKKEISRYDEIMALLDCFHHSPILVIKLKFLENNILWNFFQSSDSWHDLGGWVYYPGLGDEFGFESLRAPYAAYVQKIIDYSRMNPILNALLWRMGIPAFVWLLLAVYAIEHHYFSSMLISVPIMLQWIILMIVLQFQVYRYLWILFLAVILQLIFILNFRRTGS